MNYSKNVSRKQLGKRVVILLAIVAVIFGGIGIIIGYSVKSHMTVKYATKSEKDTDEKVSEDFAVYGAYDDRIFTKEVSFDWSTPDVDFKPYEVKWDEKEQEFLFYLCKGYNLDFSLLVATVQTESDFNKSLISSTNDYGLMQINKMNHAELTKILGVTDYLNAEQNMRAGCYILRKLFEKYQSPALVLMAYNMGETGAKRLWNEGIYETDYTRKVFSAQRKLRKAGESK